ncbi:MAG: hypothetical protein ACRYG6_15785 [Janthinobacterium lividum]
MSDAPAAALPSLREIATSAWADRRRIRRAIGATFALAVLVAALVPARYVTSSSLVVLLGSEFTYRPEAGGAQNVSGALGADQIMKAEVEILGADDLHEATLRRIGLDRVYPGFADPPGTFGRLLAAVAGLPRAAREAVGLPVQVLHDADPVALAVARRFDNDLTTEAAKDANVLTVTFRNRDPDVAADVVNTLVALYLERRHALYGDVQSATVQTQVRALSDALGQADAALAAFKASHDIDSFGLQRDLLLHRRDDLARALADSEASRAQLSARAASIARQLAATPASVRGYTEDDPDSRASSLTAGLQDLRGRAADLANRYLPTSRVMQDAQAQVAAREGELSRLRADHTASVQRQTRNPTLDALSLDGDRASTDLRAETARAAALAADARAVAAALHDLQDSDEALQQLERRREVADSAYRASAKVLDDRRMVEAVAAERATNVRVIQPARVPLRPHRLTLPILAAGLVFSLLAGAAAAVLSDATRPGFLSPEQVERRLGLPVLACIPEL